MSNNQNQNQTLQSDAFNVSTVNIQPTVLLDAKTRFEAKIAISEQPMQWLANAIQMAIDDAVFKPVEVSVITHKDQEGNDIAVTSVADLFMICAKVAIAARVVQCGGLRGSFDKKNFEYVSLLGPVLGMYGVYHDASEAYDIVPVLDDDIINELKEVNAIDKNGNFQIPSWYGDAMFIFRRYHLMTNYGLPKEVTVDSNQCFKITVDNNAVVGKPGASTREVLISALVHSSKMTDLFGAYRTLYTGIETLRTTFEAIGLKALHDLSV